jgi:hypothetical protein
VLRDALVISNTKADWLVPSEALIAPRALVVWEYARESETIINIASSLRRLLASSPTGALSSEAFKQLIKNVRESGYRYADFIFPEYSSPGDDWADQVFALVAKLDRVMPTTDWRFVLSTDFPSMAWWRRDQRTVAPRQRHVPAVDEHKTPRANTGLSLRELVDYHFPQPEQARIVYAIDFQYDDFEIVASEDLLPQVDESHYKEDDHLVPVILVAIPLEQWNPEKSVDAIRALAESANRLAHDRGSGGLYEVRGFSVIALAETIMDGTENAPLSIRSRNVFEGWMRARRHVRNNRFRGIVVPRIDLRTTPKFWRQFLADSFRQAARAGWTQDQGQDSEARTWSFAELLLAMKRLSALRVSKHLTFVKIQIQLGRADQELAETLARHGRKGGGKLKQSRRSGSPVWPSFQKKSHLITAARAASEEFHRIFPTLREEPYSASLPPISEARLRTRT